MRNINSNISTFENLIRENFLYVDKTEYIWKLVEIPLKMYFLSRPRRFGKSLTLSTLKAVFEGRKELFKGLAIYDKPYDWKPYPVIHLDLGNCDAATAEELRKYLAALLRKITQDFNLKVSILEDQLAVSFELVISALASRSQVAILIDEYDKPILNTLTTPEAESCRNVLKGFYSSIKKCEQLERFVLVTGVSKFCHVSLFSDLNNLSDISMDERFAAMLGYTQTELEQNFAEHIEDIASLKKITPEELKQQMKEWYDGYKFHARSENVYNPFSIARFFEMGGEFKNFWFESGTPAFLIKLIREQDFNFEKHLCQPVLESAFQAYETDSINPLTLLLQTGYLTIRSAQQDFGVTEYQLDFPNREVAEAFNTYLMHAYTGYPRPQTESFVMQLAQAVRNGDVDRFMEIWRGFLAGIPYDIQLKQEKYYQTIFFAVFKALGYFIQAEVCTNSGRIDAVCSCGQWLYILEFKLNQTDEIALQQIRDNDYFRRYADSGKRVILIGANFTFANRQLSGWKYEEVAPCQF